MPATHFAVGTSMRSLIPSVRQAARQAVIAALSRHEGRALPAAAELGVSYRSMARWIAADPTLRATDNNCHQSQPQQGADATENTHQTSGKPPTDNLRHQETPQLTIIVTLAEAQFIYERRAAAISAQITQSG